MKKMVALFVFIVSLLIFYQSFYTVSCYQIGETQLVKQFQDEYQCNYQGLYLVANNDVSMDQFNRLNLLADKYHFSYSLVSYSPMEGSNVEYEDIYLYTKEHINNDLFFLEEQPFIDFSSNDNRYYSAELSDKKAFGYITTLDNNRFIKQNSIPRFHPISQIESILSNGNKDFFISVYTPNNVNVNTIVEEYNSQQGFTLSLTDSKILDIETQTEAVIERVNLLLIVSFFMIMTFVSVYILNNRRDYLIRKMNGVSTISIFLQMYLKFIIFLIAEFFIGLNICFMIWVGSFNQVSRLFYSELLNISVIVLIGFLILSLFIIAFINIQSNLRFLKMRQKYQYMFPIHQVIKTVLITVLILPILVSVQDMEPFINNYVPVKSIETEINNYYIYRKYVKNDEAFFEKYFDSQIYCDFHEYYNFSEFSPFNKEGKIEKESLYPYPYIIVNDNYLKGYELYYQNGEKINFDDITQEAFLVPLAYKNKDLSRYDYLTADNIIYIENTGRFINKEMYSIYTVSNPIIHVVNKEHVGLNPTSLIFVIANNKEKATLINELKTMNEVGYVHADSTLVTPVKIAYDYYLRELSDGIILFLMVMVIYGLLVMSLIYQSSNMFIKEFGKHKMIEYIQGKSYLKRYYWLYLCNLFTTLLPSMMALYIYDLPSMLVLQYTLICVVVELVIEMLLIHRMEKRSSISILNGKND